MRGSNLSLRQKTAVLTDCGLDFVYNNYKYNHFFEGNMSDNKEMLGTAPIGKLLFKLAVPTVIAQLINMLYNVIDRIYIGQRLKMK